MAELIKKENDIAEFNIEIEADEFKKALNKAYQENKKYFELPGFRKGKAPRKLIENAYGKEIFYEDAVNHALNEKYGPAIDELGLNVVDYPEINLDTEVEEGKPFTVNVKVQLKPEPEVSNYTGQKLEILESIVSDEDVDQMIESERQANARLITVEDGAEEGDTANIDFEGFQDGVAFEGGQGEAYDLVLGSGSFIPGFEDQLIGAKEGDEIEVNVTFPEDYHEELAGKDAVFNVKVNSVKRKELPELDDDFAMDISEFDTFDEYRNSVKEKLEDQNEATIKNRKVQAALDYLINNMEVEVPEAMIVDQAQNRLDDMANQFAQYGMSIEDFYGAQGMTQEAMLESLKPEAERNVKEMLALEAFIRAEDIEVNEDEIEEEVRLTAEQIGSDDVDKFVEDFLAEGQTGTVEDILLNRKAFDRIVEIFEFDLLSEEDYHKEDEAEETEEAEEVEEVEEENTEE